MSSHRKWSIIGWSLVVIGLISIGFSFTQASWSATCERTVRSGTSLQSSLNAAGQNKVVCLSGTFSAHDVRPLHGQTIVGGVLHGSSGDGFNLSAGDVTLRGVEVYGFPGRGVVCGPGSEIASSYLHDNRRNGIGCIAQGGDWHLWIHDNRIVHNGSEAWAYQGAAGIKIMELSRPGHCLTCGALIEDNEVLNNIGNGIWFDRSSSAATVRGNVANDNTHKGIRCEKCAGPFDWYGNTARGNHDENFSIRNSAYLHLWNNVSGSSMGLRISFITREARKTYPDLSPVDDGYHIKSIVVEDTRLLAGGTSGCQLSGVRCQ